MSPSRGAAAGHRAGTMLVVGGLLIAALCARGAHGHISDAVPAPPPSPCPRVFQYEPSQLGATGWAGVVRLQTPPRFSSLRLTVQLAAAEHLPEDPAPGTLSLRGGLAQARALVRAVHAGRRANIEFVVEFADGVTIVPSLLNVTVNGRLFCASREPPGTRSTITLVSDLDTGLDAGKTADEDFGISPDRDAAPVGQPGQYASSPAVPPNAVLRPVQYASHPAFAPPIGPWQRTAPPTRDAPGHLSLPRDAVRPGSFVLPSVDHAPIPQQVAAFSPQSEGAELTSEATWPRVESLVPADSPPSYSSHSNIPPPNTSPANTPPPNTRSPNSPPPITPASNTPPPNSPPPNTPPSRTPPPNTPPPNTPLPNNPPRTSPPQYSPPLNTPDPFPYTSYSNSPSPDPYSRQPDVAASPPGPPWTSPPLAADLVHDADAATRPPPVATGPQAAECGRAWDGANPLVTRGAAAVRGRWPWLVALFKKLGRRDQLGLNFECGASLVSGKHVVTAAHCVEVRARRGRPSRPLDAAMLVVYLGKHDLLSYTEPGQQTAEVEAVLPHPDYARPRSSSSTSSTFDNDIALLVLAEAVESSRHIRPVCLWEDSLGSDLSTVVGQVGAVPGWGKDDTGAISNEIRVANMPIVSQEACLRSDIFFHAFTTETTFCAGFRNGTSVCNGDSGGGLFLRGADGRWRIRGVVSVSMFNVNEQACDVYNYAVFTDVAKFIPWLRSQMASTWT